MKTMKTRKRTKHPEPHAPVERRERSAPAGAEGADSGAMNHLAADITQSFDARIERLDAIRRETADGLAAVQRHMRTTAEELEAGAADLRRFLTDAAASLRDDTGALMSRLGRHHDARAQVWRRLGATMQKKRHGARA